MHLLDPAKGFSQLWYDEEYSEEAVLEGWGRMLTRYGGYWNLFGLDIKNECHDQCSWGKGNEVTDFNLYVQRFIATLGERFPEYQGLFLVEGIHMHAEGRTPSPYKQWWGGNLFGADRYPIRTGNASLDDRVAYSPHIYGPDVYNMTYFSEPDFPDNLDDVWDVSPPPTCPSFSPIFAHSARCVGLVFATSWLNGCWGWWCNRTSSGGWRAR